MATISAGNSAFNMNSGLIARLNDPLTLENLAQQAVTVAVGGDTHLAWELAGGHGMYLDFNLPGGSNPIHVSLAAMGEILDADNASSALLWEMADPPFSLDMAVALGMDGSVTLDFLIPAAGSFTLVFDADGNLIDQQFEEVTTEATLAEFMLRGADSITGSWQGDVLVGLKGNDTLVGGSGVDNLSGGPGKDALHGGWAKDVLKGGSGADQFVFDSGPYANQQDTIKDFVHGTDQIVLDTSWYTWLGLPGNLAAGKFYGGTAAHDKTDRIIYDQVSGKLYYDLDGTGPTAKVLIAVLTGSPDDVAASDFRVI